MSDKLEALSQPIAYTDREELDSMRGPDADTYANLWTIPHGCGQDLALYSQEYVTALREDAARWFKAFEKAVSAGARYEERIAELENDGVRQRLANAEHQLYMKDLAISNIRASRKAQFKKRREAEQQITSLFERVSGEQVSNYPAGCIDWLADMIEGEMCASEGALSAMRTRAEAAEQRLELVREQRDNELRTNSELERRLQQPSLADVMAERQRQRDKGRDDVNDDSYIDGVLALGGAAYAVSGAGMNGVGTYRLRAKNLWPFPLKTFKPAGNFNRRHDLVRGAAMIIAEIDKIDRKNSKAQGLEKPTWDSHAWPQIVQDSGGKWYGVRAGWKMSIQNNWKGNELCLLHADGEFLKYGKPSPNWRKSLEQRPKNSKGA